MENDFKNKILALVLNGETRYNNPYAMESGPHFYRVFGEPVFERTPFGQTAEARGCS